MDSRTANTRRSLAALPPSPRQLTRSKSGNSLSSITSTAPEITGTSQRFSYSQRFGSGSNNGKRSKSTMRSSRNSEEENVNLYMKSTISSIQKKPQLQQETTKSGNFARFLQRGNGSTGTTSPCNSASKMPSAWALSPGRSLGSPLMKTRPTSPEKPKRRQSGMSGVLKYFKQKKVSAVQEEEFHSFRILRNRLLQWRFVNARAEANIAKVNRMAEIQLFSVWLGIFKIRNAIVEKRLEVKRLRHCIKAYEIIYPQFGLLNEWAKMERRNHESVSRLAVKLSTLSERLPLVHGAKADLASIYQAMSTALEAMDNVEAEIKKCHKQLAELMATVKQEEEILEELQEALPFVTRLMENEKNIRVHLIQSAMILRSDQVFHTSQNCKISSR